MSCGAPCAKRTRAPRARRIRCWSSGTRITRKQLDYLYSLARDRQIPRDRLAARCIEDFHKKPEFLTRMEASAVIESLKKEVA